MGVLNVTPDSFSDGGRFELPDKAIAHAEALREAGADIIDVGGESTRPGSEAVSAGEELRRVIPVLEALRDRGFEGLSIDTTKAEVAERAVAAGADIINDISGLGFDGKMARVVAASDSHVILGHTRGLPKTMQEGEIVYGQGVVRAVSDALAIAIDRAESEGVLRGRILADPGFGFGKTVAHNCTLLRELRTLHELGVPLCVGTSRKRFLGTLTGRNVEARGYATAASVALAVMGGASMVRVHDVGPTLDVVRVSDAVMRGPPPSLSR